MFKCAHCMISLYPILCMEEPPVLCLLLCILTTDFYNDIVNIFVTIYCYFMRINHYFRAKSKNGGHHLRQNLEEKGLSLPPGRRKQTDITLFTSLVEGEALHLANDHRRICQNFFPHHELAQIIGQQHANSPQNQERQRMVEGARYRENNNTTYCFH